MPDSALDMATLTDVRRERGCYYTPQFVVRFMLDLCFKALRQAEGDSQRGPLRILDPACGDGAFLLEAFEQLEQRQEKRRPLDVVRDHLFGVDIDAEAVESLRDRLCDRVAPDQTNSASVHSLIETHACVGDALTGPGWARKATGDVEREPAPKNNSRCDNVEGLDFGATFSQVAGEGGFDLVIGNPPYRRELNAKQLFDHLADSPLGRRWRQARMDLWYYFVHRGLDLLRPGGILSFIVNGYWTASTGAEKMIRRLQSETTIEEVVLLGDAPIFEGVTGQHLIFRIRKQAGNASCRVLDLSNAGTDLPSCLGDLADDPTIRSTSVKRSPDDASLKIGASDVEAPSYDVPHRALFAGGRLILSRPSPWLSVFEARARLDESFDVRQGMAENPPAVNARIVRNFGSIYRVGEGVFVLDREEIERLGLSPDEHDLLRPYYSTREVGRFWLPEQPTSFVLYLTKKTAPSLEGRERIRLHLERFRPILDRRRETRRGAIGWWHLHWPREERIFTDPRILCVQMGRAPQFVWTENPTYVGFSMNVILVRHTDAPSLPALTGILNSRLARRWFERHAKRRGVHIEISGTLLRSFPLPKRTPDDEKLLEQLVITRQECERNSSSESRAGATDSRKADTIERQIDQAVCRLYGIDHDRMLD